MMIASHVNPRSVMPVDPIVNGADVRNVEIGVPPSGCGWFGAVSVVDGSHCDDGGVVGLPTIDPFPFPLHPHAMTLPLAFHDEVKRNASASQEHPRRNAADPCASE